MLLRPSTAFSIPRKPVPHRTASMDQSRYSMESHYTFSEPIAGPESKSVHRRPSVIARHNTQDSLDALDTCLPQTPPSLRSKPGPEPVYTLYRRASEQSLRLRTHLEERSQIERRLPDFDVIPEERHMDVSNKSEGLSPILDRDEVTPVDDLLGNRASDHTRSNSSPSLASSKFQLRSSLAIPVPAPIKPSRRSVVSQWLLKSVSSQMSLRGDCDYLAQSSTADYTGHQACAFRDRSSTDSSTIYSSSTAADLASPMTTPHSSPHKKLNSVSTYHTVSRPRMSYDWEKKPVVLDVNQKSVGMAF